MPMTGKYLLSGLFLLFCSNTVFADHNLTPDISFGGRIKIDTLYNNHSVSNSRKSKSDLAFSPASIPLGSREDDFDINLRESRIWATLHIPVFDQSLSGYVEFDFFDTERDNAGISHVANKPRLRHLYASMGGITVGKTYTSFVNMSAYPEINDANGPVGVLSIRQPLIRYRHDFDNGELAVSLEHAESTFTGFTGNRVQVNDHQLADIVARYTLFGEFGNVSVSAMVRQIYSDDRLTTGMDDTKWGGAISTAGRIFLSGQDNLRFTLSLGNTLGRYLSYGSLDDATLDNSGDINLTGIVGGFAAYQHWWRPTLRSSLVVGGAYSATETSITGNRVNKYLASTTMNLLWSPTTKSTVGIEYLHGYRQQYTGQDGNIDRIQLSVIYKFD